MPPHAASTDMLDVLVADPSLVEDDVVAVLRASMLASFGSPGVALSWAVREITEHEEVRRQLSAEARQVLASGGSWMTTALFRTAGRSSARSCACTRRPG
jgi:cytochrome P450